MCVDAHVPDRASQVFVFAVVDVTTSLRVDVLFGQPKIDHVHDVSVATRKTSDQTIFRL